MNKVEEVKSRRDVVKDYVYDIHKLGHVNFGEILKAIIMGTMKFVFILLVTKALKLETSFVLSVIV